MILGFTNGQPNVVKEEMITFKDGDTIEDIKQQLIDNNSKFQVSYCKEYYRNKTKKLPKHIDICCSLGVEYKSYTEFQNSPEYAEIANQPILKVKLEQAMCYNGADFLNMVKSNTEHYILTFILKTIKLDDTTTPRMYSLTAYEDEIDDDEDDDF